MTSILVTLHVSYGNSINYVKHKPCANWIHDGHFQERYFLAIIRTTLQHRGGRGLLGWGVGYRGWLGWGIAGVMGIRGGEVETQYGTRGTSDNHFLVDMGPHELPWLEEPQGRQPCAWKRGLEWLHPWDRRWWPCSTEPFMGKRSIRWEVMAACFAKKLNPIYINLRFM